MCKWYCTLSPHQCGSSTPLCLIPSPLECPSHARYWVLVRGCPQCLCWAGHTARWTQQVPTSGSKSRQTGHGVDTPGGLWAIAELLAVTPQLPLGFQSHQHSWMSRGGSQNLRASSPLACLHCRLPRGVAVQSQEGRPCELLGRVSELVQLAPPHLVAC